MRINTHLANILCRLYRFLFLGLLDATKLLIKLIWGEIDTFEENSEHTFHADRQFGSCNYTNSQIIVEMRKKAKLGIRPNSIAT